MRRALVPAVAALVLAAPALSAGSGSTPDILRSPGLRAAAPEPRLTKDQVTRIFLQNDKVADWLRHYPSRLRQTKATYKAQSWTVKIWAGKAGEVATGRVDDKSGAVTEAWTGPQVAWKMARGYSGAFGGKQINSAPFWLGF